MTLWIAAALVGLASATALGGTTTGSLGAGGATVAACDPDGFTVTHVLSGTTVTDLIVGDIAAGCGGGDLAVTVTEVGGAVVGAGGPLAVPGGGGSVTVPLAPTPDQSVIDKHRIRVLGP